MAKKDSVIIKRGTQEDWGKSNYAPEENVIIIMEYNDGTIGLMIGDGITNVNKLPDILKNKNSFSNAIVDEKENTLIL